MFTILDPRFIKHLVITAPWGVDWNTLVLTNDGTQARVQFDPPKARAYPKGMRLTRKGPR